MFTGFNTENNPAIQVWDFSGTSSASNASIALTDDCAPIQFFKTGGDASNGIKVILPASCVEGRQIKIINARFAAQVQKLSVFSLDARTNTVATYILGQGQTLDLCYSKQFLSSGSSTGNNPTGWISLNQAPSTAANFASFSGGGNNCNVQGLQSSSIAGDNNLISGDYSVALGGNGISVSGSNAGSVGGQSNTISGNYCGSLGGANNSVSGNYSVSMGGQSNTVSSISGVVAGTSNQASGSYSSVLAGQSNSAFSQGSSVVGGNSNQADASYAVVVGGYYGRTRSIEGNFVTPASNNPIAFAGGVSQSALLVLGVVTTNATATVLRSNTSAASTTNQVILPNNSAYYVKGSIIANVTGGGNTKSWDFIATIKRGANAASTAIVGAVTLNVQAADAGASTWIVAITANTTNGGLAVTVTGQASTTIRWVAKLESTEVTY